MHACMHACMHAYMRECKEYMTTVAEHQNKYTYMNAYIHTYIKMCKRISDINIYIYIYIYIYTCMHTYINERRKS